ncbi:hypothetical protein C1T17_02870 [Sphingobium sp. SCG-1]|uniref:MFS transporter n=1 Tax=Sphingobium sp. SCG-1 TaxID=2072936 RepID=UPI000CD68D97|nr:MFS transporter [Sphingobium sp. SCG-1]AUW57187.1 hypothetical protein C1T17_02870 [Sphingobium sp. SCG-1]
MDVKGSAGILSDLSMTRQQWMVVGLLIALNGLDGFDVLAITFAAPAVAVEWQLPPTALGIVLSAGLAGMMLGSLVIGPMSDRLGRRPVVLFCLAVMAAGTLWSAATADIGLLASSRLLTGVGIGGLLPTMNALVAEFSNTKHRDLNLSLMVVGYPVGGVIGGLISAHLIEVGGWRMIFYAASALSLLGLVSAWKLLPESVDFEQQRASSTSDVDGVNRVLAHLKQRLAESLPVERPERQRGTLFGAFAAPYTRGTSVILAAYLLHALNLYFFISWLPKLLVESGWSQPAAIATATFLNLGAIAGGVLCGALSHRLGLDAVLITALGTSSVLAVIFGVFGPSPDFAWILIAVIGGLHQAGVVGFYALIARFYPPSLRSTGAGAVLGLGRGGAVCGPLLGGAFLAANFQPQQVVLIVGFSSALSALVLVSLRSTTAPSINSEAAPHRRAAKPS